MHKIIKLTALFLALGIYPMAAQSIGEKYINFIRLFTSSKDASLSKEIEALFAPSFKKVVNSNEIAHNREETFKQMNDIKSRYGITEIKVHEYLESADHLKCAIRWEVTYTDGDVETVISIITANAHGLITEVNEVFGQKDIYQWFPK